MRPLRLAPAVLICVLAAGCWPGRSREARQVVPELTMEGVRFSIERGGLRRASGEAERLTYRRDTTAVAAEGLVLHLAGADGDVRISAPRGWGVANDRRFDVEGGIQAARGDDLAVTAAAHYEAPQRGPGVVTGHDPVVVTGPGYRLTGRGFRLLPATSEIILVDGARLVAGLPVTP